jgi:hypothetical protein
METETLIEFEKSLESITSDKQAFHHIARNLIKQNVKSRDSYIDEEDGEQVLIQNEECAYIGINEKTGEKTRCAVGWLILENIYNPEIEGRPVYDSDVEDIITNSTPNWNKTEESFSMLAFAQRVHDSHEVESWQKVLSIANSRLFWDGGSFKLNKIAIDTVADDIIKSYKEERYFGTNYPNAEQ